tara:strand:- start:8298 stop:8657 length:360 start_codon:yes stop_codon:yes gene_type:complete
MGISSIAAVGAGGSSPIGGHVAAEQASGASKGAGIGQGRDIYEGSAGQLTGAPSWYGKNHQMSTSNFVTLTQKIAAANKSGGIMDPKEIASIIAALKILEKVVELVGEILDNLIGEKES